MRGGVFAPAVRAGAGRGEWEGERGAVRCARGAVRRAGRDERGAVAEGWAGWAGRQFTG